MPGELDLTALEERLEEIPAVSAARVVGDDDGNITEVHVIATGEKHVKQVVRDVQTVAKAVFDVDVDHRTVSIVQFDAQPASSQPGVESERPSVAERRVLAGVGVEPDDGRVRARVTLGDGDIEVTGEASAARVASATPRVVAEAALDGLARLVPRAREAVLEHALVVTVGRHELFVVTVLLPAGAYEEVLTGAAVVRSSGLYDAAARALLDATNRRLPARG